MKQQIICPKCMADHPDLFIEKSFKEMNDGIVHIKNMRGVALYGFLCDFCGSQIGEGMECNANTMWQDSNRVPYHPWETDYIQPYEKENDNGR